MKKIRILAIACAVIVAIGLFAVLQKVDKEEEVRVNVVVAAADIPQNTILTQDFLEIKAVPEDMVLGGSYSDAESLIGKMARVDIKAGEQIISDRINEVGDRGSANLAMMVEEGKRAVTIAVDSVSGLSGMLRPGDQVDVVAHVEQKAEGAEAAEGEEGTAEEKEMVSMTIVENVPVLAVDSVMSSQGKGDGYTTVTLMVTPKQANEIDWSANRGILRLVLRTPLDEESVKTNKVNGDDMGKKQ